MRAQERRSNLSLRRTARFFGAGGLCERYEARDDRLIQFGDIVDWVVALAPGVTRAAIQTRFVLSAENAGFGWWRPLSRRVARLIDLDGYASFERASYPLRPSCLTVRARPLLMRATRTTWVEWLSAQKLPGELIRTTIDHVAASAAPAALSLQVEYDKRVTGDSVPNKEQDLAWAKTMYLSPTRLWQLRKANSDPRLHQRGRKKNWINWTDQLSNLTVQIFGIFYCILLHGGCSKMTDTSTKEAQLGGLGGPITGSGRNGYPTVAEAAAAAQRSERWIRNKMAEGVIRYTTIGRTLFPTPTFLLEMRRAAPPG